MWADGGYTGQLVDLTRVIMRVHKGHESADPDSLILAKEVKNYLTISNTIRPHEAIGFATPISRYLQAPSTPPGPNIQGPATASDS